MASASSDRCRSSVAELAHGLVVDFDAWDFDGTDVSEIAPRVGSQLRAPAIRDLGRRVLAEFPDATAAQIRAAAAR